MGEISIRVSFPEELCSDPVDGRLLLMISSDDADEPRFQISNFPDSQLIYGMDVEGLKPGD